MGTWSGRKLKVGHIGVQLVSWEVIIGAAPDNLSSRRSDHFLYVQCSVRVHDDATAITERTLNFTKKIWSIMIRALVHSSSFRDDLILRLIRHRQIKLKSTYVRCEDRVQNRYYREEKCPITNEGQIRWHKLHVCFRYVPSFIPIPQIARYFP